MASQSKVDALNAAMERLQPLHAGKHFRFLDLPKEIRLMVGDETELLVSMNS